MEIIKVLNQDHAHIVSNLAEEIWHEHYDNMVGNPCVDYMLKTFQSVEIILQELQAKPYYLIKNHTDYIGYFSFSAENPCLFISKLYLKKSARGKGYGRQAFEFIENHAKNQNFKQINLKVNRKNIDAINIYFKLGFNITDCILGDSGNSFFTDDFLMVKDI